MADISPLKMRIRSLHKGSNAGSCVVYVMSRDQRVADNHALLVAQKHALATKQPLIVVFNLYTATGYRSYEQYQFMLDGLRAVDTLLHELHIPFRLYVGLDATAFAQALTQLQPDVIYYDFHALSGARSFQETVSKTLNVTSYVVDTHNCVPLWIASEKREVGAYTLRPKLHKLLSNHLVESEVLLPHPFPWVGESIPRLQELENQVQQLLAQLPKNGTTSKLQAGELAALAALEAFITDRLPSYVEQRNNPAQDGQSDLSAYLHFGQLSALRVVLRMQELLHQNNSELHILQSPKLPQPNETETTLLQSIHAFVEELVVRKELADNYCYYTPSYLSLQAAAPWANATLAEHAQDPREHSYTFEQLRDAKTHDNSWNAAQIQLLTTGKMHGYMRMYWAKKVLEWSPTEQQPEEVWTAQHRLESKLQKKLIGLTAAPWAIEVLYYLNDFYSLDGGDPNGYAGIMWSVAGIHDRTWFERPIFGKIRYMNEQGLLRKFPIAAYQQQFKGV